MTTLTTVITTIDAIHEHDDGHDYDDDNDRKREQADKHEQGEQGETGRVRSNPAPHRALRTGLRSPAGWRVTVIDQADITVGHRSSAGRRPVVGHQPAGVGRRLPVIGRRE